MHSTHGEPHYNNVPQKISVLHNLSTMFTTQLSHLNKNKKQKKQTNSAFHKQIGSYYKMHAHKVEKLI